MSIQAERTVISLEDFEKKVEMECMFIMRETGKKNEPAYELAKAAVGENFVYQSLTVS